MNRSEIIDAGTKKIFKEAVAVNKKAFLIGSFILTLFIIPYLMLCFVRFDLIPLDMPSFEAIRMFVLICYTISIVTAIEDSLSEDVDV